MAALELASSEISFMGLQIYPTVTELVADKADAT